ncbi:MAG: response regulator [Planctomycetes bacterium]|jgi:CheY-like chemotaxis protein|nr:response regulator [Planctomycetota bacterium]
MANKVLVADDEIHIIHVVAIKLRNNGYEVIAANNGAEAYDLACRENPDVVVTDYQMPLMTGLELVTKMRTDERTRDIPVILLTARSFAVSQEQQESLGIASCLSKPFSPKELLKTIQDILHQRQLAAKC